MIHFNGTVSEVSILRFRERKGSDAPAWPGRDLEKTGVRFDPRPLSEVVAVFTAIMGYIWFVRPVAPWAWALLLAALVSSHLLNREGFDALGLGGRNLIPAMRFALPWALLGCLLIPSAGVISGTTRFAHLAPDYLLTR